MLPSFSPELRLSVRPIYPAPRVLHETEAVTETELTEFVKNVEATIPALRRFARALTRDSEIADDLVQDTLLRALRSEHLFRGGQLRSWLYTILSNLNRNRLRSLARRPTFASLESNDVPDVTGPDGTSSDIERALASLTENQRNALVLVVLEGLSYSEVAEIQGVPIGTVMSRLARARVGIKDFFEIGSYDNESSKTNRNDFIDAKRGRSIRGNRHGSGSEFDCRARGNGGVKSAC